MEAAPHPWPALGVLLMRDGLVTKENLEAVLDEQLDGRQQRISGHRLGEILVERGFVTQVQVAELVAEQYELPFVDLDVSDIDLEVAALLDEKLSRRFSAVPIGARPDGSFLVAIGDPASVLFSDELRRVLDASPRFAVVGSEALETAIEFVHHRAPSAARSSADSEAHAPDGSLVLEPPESGEPDSATDTNAVAYFGSHRAVAHLWPPLGALLMREGLVSDAELETALAQQRLSASRRLGEILVDRGSVTRTDVARLVAEQYELPFVEVDVSEIDADAAALLPVDVARTHSALPIGFLPDGSLRVVVADPTTVLHSDELQLALEARLSYALAAPDAIEAALESFHGRAPLEAIEETEIAEDEPEDPDPHLENVEPKELDEVFRPNQKFDPEPAFDLDEADADVVDNQADAAIVPEAPTLEDGDEGFTVAEILEVDVPPSPTEVSAIGETHSSDTESAELAAYELDERLERALEPGVTALHFSPQATGLLLRARIDGVMRELEPIPSSLQESVISRLKETTQLDFGDRTVQVRVEVLPTKEGERLTLHVLRQDPAPSSVADLGMAPELEEMLRSAIDAPLGAILFCGPAGSGTTTTLHATLRALNTTDRQLITIEDPVEQVIPGIDQVEVDSVAGRTFADGLHSILRSDPDVVGIGEIREEETARIAVEAATTDGLVLATLRVRTASAAIRQLTDMGVDGKLLSSALACVVAQGLARRVCSDCREGYYATPDELNELDRPAEETSRRLLARGRGCITCGGTGYRGRVGVFEILPLTNDIRGLVAAGASTAEIQAAAVVAGMHTLREDGIRLCLEGVTTAAEVQRVVGDQDA